MTHRSAAGPGSARAGRAAGGGGAAVRTAVLATLIALAVAACTATGASPSPTVEPTAELASPLVATPGGSPAAPSGTPGRTTTAWGEIWDALPASFPLPAGASPADLPEGPFSGTYTTSAAAAATADAIVSGLAARGYRPVDRSGPTEAGGVTIDATGSAAGCRVRVNVVPLGGLTAIEVLYGTACPIR